MANRDNPHGFRPLMRTLAGGPGASLVGCHKLVGYGTALFIHDVITFVASGTKPTKAISAAVTPGTTPIAGVNMNYGAASTATDHLITPASGDQVFEAQDNNDTDGIAAADINKNFNVELNAGNTTSKISGHEIDESTIATTNTLDGKIHGIFRSPDNAFGSWCRAEVTINRKQLADQVAGI